MGVGRSRHEGVRMNFNVGEVLTRAWEITWRHKNLWLAGMAVTLISFLSVPISLLLNPSFSSLSESSDMNQALPSILIINGLALLMTVLSIPVYVVGMAIPSLATVELEKGVKTVNLGELIREVLPFFWRILGIAGLLWLGMFAVVIVFVACIILLSVITFGFGVLCALPLFLLLIPSGILAYALMEQGVSAVLVDKLGFSSALQRAWELVWKNPGVMALLSIIIYLGTAIISMIIAIPMMIPIFGFLFNMGSEPDLKAVEDLSRNMNLWMLAF